jgi:hypothetical protein
MHENIVCGYCGWPRGSHAFKNEVDPEKAEEKLASIPDADIKKRWSHDVSQEVPIL